MGDLSTILHEDSRTPHYVRGKKGAAAAEEAGGNGFGTFKAAQPQPLNSRPGNPVCIVLTPLYHVYLPVSFVLTPPYLSLPLFSPPSLSVVIFRSVFPPIFMFRYQPSLSIFVFRSNPSLSLQKYMK